MVSPAAIYHIRQLYINPKHVVFDLIPLTLNKFLVRCYHQLGCPSVRRSTVWIIYCNLLNLVRQCEGIPAVLTAIVETEGHEAVDELQLLPGLQDLHETEGYMGGVANGLGLRKDIRSISGYHLLTLIHFRGSTYAGIGSDG